MGGTSVCQRSVAVGGGEPLQHHVKPAEGDAHAACAFRSIDGDGGRCECGTEQGAPARQRHVQIVHRHGDLCDTGGTVGVREQLGRVRHAQAARGDVAAQKRHVGRVVPRGGPLQVLAVGAHTFAGHRALQREQSACAGGGKLRHRVG
ncbi:hypothetical protein SDC9_105110 [bioreactor metagenome]|uniref:Uncharacterized protein n=1 Tax=bioreactor metagenome TaxID=1076179 RepID=A0A645AYR6_9ZZZZ